MVIFTCVKVGCVGVGYGGRSSPEEKIRQALRNSTGTNRLEFQAPREPNNWCDGVAGKACEF
jgi:hypothetical protein